MAADKKVEENLAKISALERAGRLAEDQLGLLREALGDINGSLIAAAARIAQKRHVQVLESDLARAFNGLLTKPAKADKGCLAKAALAEALNALDCHDAEVFLRGVRYIQEEPAYGRAVDTAARGRAECAIGLGRIGHPQADRQIVGLLVDPEPEARAASVRALVYLGGDPADLLLRLKALSGDNHPAVVGECLSALMKPGSPFVICAGYFAAQSIPRRWISLASGTSKSLATWPSDE